MKFILFILKKILLLLLVITILISGYVGYAVMTRNKAVSASGEVVNTFYKMIQPKRFLQTLVDNPKRLTEPLSPSANFSEKYTIFYKNLEGHELITASLEDHNNIHLIYLHGGAYILGKEGMKIRETLVSQLIDHTNAKVTFFDYPVAPESQYQETLDSMTTMYRYLLETYPDDRFMFMGDSAGGGLALAFGQMIKDEAIKQPEKFILYSPWLDVSMTNPGIEALEEFDMVLSKDALVDAANKYVGSNDYKNPLVSPIYGDFKGLGDILMFYGTHELLYADALKLEALALENTYNISFNYYTEMQHVWILVPISETKQTLQESYDFILKD